MRRPGTHLRRALLAAMLVVAAGSLGNNCAEGGGPTAPKASLVLQESGTFPIGGGGFLSLVSVYANASLAYQAFDIDHQWTPANANVIVVASKAGTFSDDGPFSLVRIPALDLYAGTLTGMLDVRHGPTAAVAGAQFLAEVFVISLNGETVTLSASGTVARPGGLKFDTSPAPAIQLTPP